MEQIRRSIEGGTFAADQRAFHDRYQPVAATAER
jgi:hypothetical protein